MNKILQLIEDMYLVNDGYFICDCKERNNIIIDEMRIAFPNNRIQVAMTMAEMKLLKIDFFHEDTQTKEVIQKTFQVTWDEAEPYLDRFFNLYEQALNERCAYPEEISYMKELWSKVLKNEVREEDCLKVDVVKKKSWDKEMLYLTEQISEQEELNLRHIMHFGDALSKKVHTLLGHLQIYTSMDTGDCHPISKHRHYTQQVLVIPGYKLKDYALLSPLVPHIRHIEDKDENMIEDLLNTPQLAPFVRYTMLQKNMPEPQPSSETEVAKKSGFKI
jgi:hypothetical protein